MAKMYYSLEEAVAKLGCDEDTLKSAVRDGKLREFRDAGTVNYKVDEIDTLASSGELGGGPPPLTDIEASMSIGPIELADTGDATAGLSAGGTTGIDDTGISLGGSGGDTTSEGTSVAMTADASGLNLAVGGDDMVSLDEDDTQSDATSAGKSKEDTVVSSVGVSVFDEEDLDESADPLAKTVMSGTAGGTGLEDVGSGGSGLLDLTRESDDTSLGAELLDEIYPGGDEGATVEMGDATRAGLDSAIPETEAATTEEAFAPDVAPTGVAASATVTVQTVEYAPDAFGHGASGLVAVGLAVMCCAGFALAAMIRGVQPSILDIIFNNLWMFGLGAVVVAGAATGVGIFLGKRSES